jgi:hypothetical protein
MSKAEAKPAWSVPIRRDDVPEEGMHIDLVADEATRAAVMALAGIRALPRLVASYEVSRRPGGLRVDGEVSATVGQTCVVTLEPVDSEIREHVDLDFVAANTSQPAPGDQEVEGDGEEETVELGAEPPEELIDDTIDLGALSVEFVLLGIDPYPRKPGAEFEAKSFGDAAANPFAALANWPGKPETSDK